MSSSRRTFLQATAAALSAQAVQSANDTIQIGVIGCGARSHQLMKALFEVPGTRITAVCDAYKGRVERAVDRTKARVFATHTDLLASPEVDAVVIVTPDHWHRQMILDAVAAGKDVYCEKPMTYRASEGPEIIAAARQKSRIVQVGSQGVSAGLIVRARDLIQSGKLGKVTMIRAAYNRNTDSGAWIYPIPPDASPSTVNWDMFQGPAPKQPFSLERFFRWRCYKDYSGGVATDLFVHLTTTIHYLMNASVPDRVVALGQLYRRKEGRDVPDTLNAVLEYPEGFAVNLSSTFNNQTAAESGFQILGTEGTLSLDQDLSFFPQVATEDNGWITESWPKALQEAYYKDPKVRRAEMGEGAPAPAKEETFKNEEGDSTVKHLANFAESIRTRKPHWEDASAGHRAAACAHMVNLAASRRMAVEWDAARDDIRKIDDTRKL